MALNGLMCADVPLCNYSLTLTWKVVSESHVTWSSSVPISVFLGLSCSTGVFSLSLPTNSHAHSDSHFYSTV